MSDSNQKIVQYLNEAHATEVALIRVLQSQIAMTPRSSYRTGLEKHLRETRDHARRVEKRLRELDAGRNPVQALTGAAEALLGQALALAKTPVDILRGTSGAEKVLKNARDASATEALEIATYTSIERLANTVGDTETARLAASIRADEEQMLERVLKEIPKLTDAVVGVEVSDGGRASNGDVPIPRYDDLSANQIVSRLSKLSEADRRRVREYERAHKKRATVLKATERTPAGA